MQFRCIISFCILTANFLRRFRHSIALVSEPGNYMLNIATRLGLLQITATGWQWQIKFLFIPCYKFEWSTHWRCDRPGCFLLAQVTQILAFPYQKGVWMCEDSAIVYLPKKSPVLLIEFEAISRLYLKEAQGYFGSNAVCQGWGALAEHNWKCCIVSVSYLFYLFIFLPCTF